MPSIFSTLTCDNNYTGYKPGGADLPVIAWQILVKGGKGVIDRHFNTGNGAVTEIDNEQLALLKTNPVFNKHVENGFVTVIEDSHVKPDTVLADLEDRDASSPLTPQDYKDPEGPKPVIASAKNNKK